MDPYPNIKEWQSFCSFFVKGNTNDCWEWKGNTNKNGYGIFPYRECSIQLAHRLAFFFEHPTEDQSLYVCHKCDNPICVNVNHLFLGTAKENSEDMVSKQRSTAFLTDREVFEILELAKTGISYRRIAKRYGVSRQHVGKIVNGKVRQRVLLTSVGTKPAHF